MLKKLSREFRTSSQMIFLNIFEPSKRMSAAAHEPVVEQKDDQSPEPVDPKSVVDPKNIDDPNVKDPLTRESQDVEEGNGFILDKNRVFLTYSHKHDKEKLEAHILKCLNMSMRDQTKTNKIAHEIVFIRAAHETGESYKFKKDEAKGINGFVKTGNYDYNAETKKNEPYEHTHVAFEFSGKPTLKGSRRFDILCPIPDCEQHKGGKMIHPHILSFYKVIKSPQGQYRADRTWFYIRRYLCKEDVENKEYLVKILREEAPLYERNDIEDLALYSDSVSMIKKNKERLNENPSHFFGLEAMRRELQPKPEINLLFIELGAKNGFNANPMQHHAINLAKNRDHTIDDPMIHFIINKDGENGKSTLAGAMEDAKLAHFIEGNGGNKDSLALNLKNAREKGGWDGKTIVFDFARSCSDRESNIMYDNLEAARNGRMTSPKYESGTWRNGFCPTVIVFLNDPPRFWRKNHQTHDDTSEPTLTLTRFDITFWKKDGSLDEVTTNAWKGYLEEAKQMYSLHNETVKDYNPNASLKAQISSRKVISSVSKPAIIDPESSSIPQKVDYYAVNTDYCRELEQKKEQEKLYTSSKKEALAITARKNQEFLSSNKP